MYVRQFLLKDDQDALKNFFEKNFWQAAGRTLFREHPGSGDREDPEQSLDRTRADPGSCRPPALMLQRPEPAPLRTQKKTCPPEHIPERTGEEQLFPDVRVCRA